MLTFVPMIADFDIRMAVPVMEHFYTLQGEGIYAGKAAYFIRLAGCDVGCVWCDVKESWTATREQLMKYTDLATVIGKSPANLAVVTGGEPCIYALESLTTVLESLQCRKHLETSGAYPISGNWDWICVSPKKFKLPLPESLMMANELKIIVYNNSDIKWAESFTDKVNGSCQLLLQPEWSKKKQMEPLIIDYIKGNPKWSLSIQTHKYLDIP